ncbi:MAG TPA: DUF2461 domain-containing protein [Xanthomonadales bacterium]|nr:DUF2461 domain-containing protein [Xanthomonadales bacterium]
MTGFAGFPADFFRFYEQLRRNNERDWFNTNKERFQQSVLEPMSAFITALQPSLAAISKHYIADPKPNGGSMFRIYRDTRFSKDKTPYKTHAACHFRHAAGKDAHAPGFYVHIDQDEVFFGGGIWQPPAPQLNRIRDFIADNARSWARIKNARKVQQAGGIKGEGLQRPPRGFDEQHLHIEDLKRKSFYIMSEAGPKDPSGAAFVEQVAQGFARAAPLNRFICDALELPF